MYQSRRSLLFIVISLMLVVFTACAPAATPTAAPAMPQATTAPTMAPAATVAPTAAPATVAPTVAPTAAAASADNTLTIDSNIDDLITLDPAVVYEYSGILVAHNVYQSLVTFVGSDLQTIKPGLADSWEIKDASDHWELTFKLHPGNKFASGNPVTADDVVYSFNRVVTY